MFRSLVVFCVTASFLLTPALTRGHEDDEPSGTPGEKLGTVNFNVTCNAAAQQEFNRALALYHSFWFDPAKRSFVKVLELDAGCGMANWGLALSSLGNPFAWPPPEKATGSGAGFIAQAQQVGAGSPREREYIDALALLFKDWQATDHRPRSLAWEQAMQKLADRHPDDIEAQIFYALALVANALPTDKTFANQLKAGAILEPLFQSRTDHPGVAHYLIHAYDYTALVERGLPAARRYAAIAPSAPHALHMPAHIFTRLGMWEESIQTNAASARAAKDELKETSLELGSYNAMHAMDYMMYAYLQRGQDKAAKQLLDEVRRIQRLDAANFPAAFALAAMSARYALERRRWDEAAALTLHPQDLPWHQFPQAEAQLVFARLLGAARTGDTARAQQDLERLKNLQAKLKEMKIGYWAQQVEIQHTAASAMLAFAQGRSDEALRTMRQAVQMEEATDKHPVTPGPLIPARELLGEMLLDLNRPAEAAAEFMRAQSTEPNRFRAIYSAALAAQLAGDVQLARAMYHDLMELTKMRDSERPEFARMHAFLAGG